MHFIPFVETAMGLLNFKALCEEILRVGPQVGLHLDAVVFGGEDFRASIGSTSSRDTLDILYARQKIIVTAKAFDLQAIDLVYIDFQDEEGLRKQSREGALMGFTVIACSPDDTYGYWQDRPTSRLPTAEPIPVTQTVSP
ncbi:UNVERIFIED_CONTAM: hypothetical protein K2H54_034990 [Gekko kuhli]